MDFKKKTREPVVEGLLMKGIGRYKIKFLNSFVTVGQAGFFKTVSSSAAVYVLLSSALYFYVCAHI